MSDANTPHRPGPTIRQKPRKMAAGCPVEVVGGVAAAWLWDSNQHCSVLLTLSLLFQDGDDPGTLPVVHLGMV